MKNDNSYSKFFLRFNHNIFPLIVILTFVALSLDLFKYAGFFERYFKISAYLLLNISFISGLLVVLTHSREFRKKGEFIFDGIFKFNNVFFPLFLIFYYSINDIESQRFSGYIFSILHLHPQGLTHLLILSMFVLFLSIYLSLNRSEKSHSLSNFDKSTL